MATKLEKCNRKVNESFRDLLHAAYTAKFNATLVTRFSLDTMCLISYPENGGSFTQEQKDFVDAYSQGYAACMNQITDWS